MTHADKKHLSCDTCGRMFSSINTFSNHKLGHINGRSLECDICGYVCTNHYKLRLHERYHKAKNALKCNACGFLTLVKNTLKLHQRQHAGNKMLSCKDCSFKCKTEAHLKIHLFSHARAKLFYCDVCCKSFFDEWVLIRHKRKHALSNELSLHDLNHTKKVANSKDTLLFIPGLDDNTKTYNKSVDTVPKNLYSCGECSFLCIEESKLDLHMLQHTDEQPIQSTDCIIVRCDPNDADLASPEPKLSKPIILACSQCSYLCFEEHKLALHEITHNRITNIVGKSNAKSISKKSPNEALSSKECEDIFDEKSDEHHSHVQGNLLSCYKCSFMCFDNNNLKVHMVLHNDEIQNNQNHSLSSNLRENQSDGNFAPLEFKEGTQEKGLIRHLYANMSENTSTCKNSTEELSLDMRFKRKNTRNSSKNGCSSISVSCDKEVAQKKTLNTHLVAHKSENTLSCKYSTEQPNLNVGVKRKTKKKLSLEKQKLSQNAFLCTECGKVCKNKRLLKLHMVVHAKIKPFICNECNRAFATKQYLKKHLIQHVDMTLFPCSQCDKVLNGEDKLNKHMMTHNRTKTFLCNICSYMCSEQYILKRHLLTHSLEKPHVCSECGFKTTNKYTLVNHKLTHKVEKRFQCHLCSYVCITNARLKVHLITHSGVRQFSCDICGKLFTTNTNLTVHKKIHSKTNIPDKWYSCCYCDYACSTLGRLKSHNLRHTGEKPFKCQICSFRCAAKTNLKTHILTHTREKPFKCHLCTHMSTTSSSLKRHLLTHTGEKPFHCDYCCYRGTSKSNLNKHVRTHLGEQPYSKKNRLKNNVEILQLCI